MTKYGVSEVRVEYISTVKKFGTWNGSSPWGAGVTYESLHEAKKAVLSGMYGDPTELALVVTFDEID